MSAVKIKICGLTDKEGIYASIKMGVDVLGFSFYEQSPVHVDPEFVKYMLRNRPEAIQAAAVFVNPTEKQIASVFSNYKFHYIQFDGDESPAFIDEIKHQYSAKIIKTFEIKEGDDFEVIEDYQEACDYFMFDGRKVNYIDNTQSLFDWGLLKNREIPKDWILAGALTKYNVQQAIRVSRAQFVNASATLDDTPGIKNPKFIEDFVKTIRIPNYL